MKKRNGVGYFFVFLRTNKYHNTMKKIISLFLALFTTMSAFAQVDVTKKYIQNPSFEQEGTSGWTVSGLVMQTNNSFEKKAGGTYLEKWVSKGNSAGSASVKQTISGLEPGKYTLTVGAQNLDQNSTSKKCTGVKISAGKSSTSVYTPNDYSVDFTFISGELEIAFVATNAGGNWIAVDNFRLTYNGAPEIDDIKPAVTSALKEANDLYGDGSGKDADKLKEAIDAIQAIIDNAETTSEQLVSALSDINAAIDAYKYANVSEEMPIDFTKYITNPSFENGGTNGWVNDGLKTQTNSSFTKKAGSTYLEKWVSAAPVGNASINQIIKGIPNGQYKLTVAAQNYNQKSTSQKCDGAVIYADKNCTNVYTPGEYSVKFTSVAGEVEIGFKAENANGNWLAVDNFRLYLIGKVDKADVVAEIKRIVSDAIALQSNMMSSSAASNLQSAIDEGSLVTESTEDADIQSIKKKLDKAISEAQISINEYKELEEAIAAAESIYDDSLNGAEDFNVSLNEARKTANNAEATSNDIAASIKSLKKAELAFNLANAKQGTGNPVKVTATNTYVVTGSTEALMRATMSGSNILEKGVCWSKEHAPTVLDERTTESHTLNGAIYHVRGLETATVYYLRPYVMNKTYEVAYGEEVKIVTHPKGTCKGTWNNGAPDEAANTRCRNAINETIEYFNQWTGIKGFTLTGNYGADTPTADCSYGGWMRIGPNAGNQAIGTVIHETGHGVGVGTSDRWWDTNVHDWEWKGREANAIYHFLENQYTNTEYVMVGDKTHGWGQKATYDWFVNGADKDKHEELQYLGGCALLYGLFIDGLCPTSSYKNGLAGYTFNFDEDKIYYIKCENSTRGLEDGFLYQRGSTSLSWMPMTAEEAAKEENNAGWYIEYDANTGYYRFRNATTGKYMTHAAGGTSVTLATKTKPANTENFQLMPGRPDVKLKFGDKTIKTYGYWFTWDNGGNKAMEMKECGAVTGYGGNSITAFNFSNSASAQRYIIIAKEDIPVSTSIMTPSINSEEASKAMPYSVYSVDGKMRSNLHKGINIIKYADGTCKKVFVKE